MGRIVFLALAAFSVLTLCIHAIANTQRWWVIAVAVVAEMAIFTVIGMDVRRLMAEDDDDEERPASPVTRDPGGARVEPGTAFTGVAGDDRAVILTTSPAGPGDVLAALGVEAGGDAAARVSVMVVSPEGFGHFNHDDERYYAEARRAEGETVDALRRAGVHAAGHVGDHDAAQAITDALVLFPATRVVVLSRGADTAAALRADVDPDALGRRTGANIKFVELRAG
jgi:hypothetical protein